MSQTDLETTDGRTDVSNHIMKAYESPETVFVIGAGVSKDFGYPLTRDLLFGLIGRLEPTLKQQFKKIVQFHHPNWGGRAAHLPDIEEFLTEVSANEDLLPVLRPQERSVRLSLCPMISTDLDIYFLAAAKSGPADVQRLQLRKFTKNVQKTSLT